MSCKHRRHDIALHVAGDLPARRAARLNRHLASCPACRALAERLEVDRLALGRLALEPVDPRSLERIRTTVLARINHLEEGRGGSGALHRGPRGGSWTLAAVAAALVLGAVGLFLWTPGRPASSGGTGPKVASTPEPVAPGPPRSEERRAAPPSPPAPQDRLEAPAPRPASRAGRRPSHPKSRPRANPRPTPAAFRSSEPLVIQVVSDQPDIVYYWLAEPEETHHESTSE